MFIGLSRRRVHPLLQTPKIEVQSIVPWSLIELASQEPTHEQVLDQVRRDARTLVATRDFVHGAKPAPVSGIIFDAVGFATLVNIFVAAKYWGEGATWDEVPQKNVREARTFALNSAHWEHELAWRNRRRFMECIDWKIDGQRIVSSGSSLCEADLRQLPAPESLAG